MQVRQVAAQLNRIRLPGMCLLSLCIMAVLSVGCSCSASREHYLRGWDILNVHPQRYWEENFTAAIRLNPERPEYWASLAEFYRPGKLSVGWYLTRTETPAREETGANASALLNSYVHFDNSRLKHIYAALDDDSVSAKLYLAALQKDYRFMPAWQGLVQTIKGHVAHYDEFSLTMEVLDEWARVDVRNALPLYWRLAEQIRSEKRVLGVEEFLFALQAANARAELIDRGMQPPQDLCLVYKGGLSGDCFPGFDAFVGTTLPLSGVAFLWDLLTAGERPEESIVSPISCWPIEDSAQQSRGVSETEWVLMATATSQMGWKFISMKQESPNRFSRGCATLDDSLMLLKKHVIQRGEVFIEKTLTAIGKASDQMGNDIEQAEELRKGLSLAELVFRRDVHGEDHVAAVEAVECLFREMIEP